MAANATRGDPTSARVERARSLHDRLLDVHDVMHVLGVGVPVFFEAWRARFAVGANEDAAARRWERLKRWVREAGLPVRWVVGDEGAQLGVVFGLECRALVTALLDEAEAWRASARERKRAARRLAHEREQRALEARRARLEALVREGA